MKLLPSIVAVVALSAASPVFASDVSSDRYFKAQAKDPQASSTTSSTAPQADAKKAPLPLLCACAKMGEHGGASRPAPAGN
jgi:hypothetical protein